ncbi:hypothetical protein COOONC_15277 [Cooperia oncophora]
MSFAEEPDYIYMTHSLKSIAKENRIDMEKKLDWVGRANREGPISDDETSSDNRNTGSEDSDDTDKNTKGKKAATKKTKGSESRKKSTSGVKKRVFITQSTASLVCSFQHFALVLTVLTPYTH